MPPAFYRRGNAPAAALATPTPRRGHTPPRERFFERPEIYAGFTFFFYRLIWGGELRRAGCQGLMEVRKGRTNRLLKSSRGMEERRRREGGEKETSRVAVSYIVFVCYVCCHGSRPGSAVVPPNKGNRGVPTAAFLSRRSYRTFSQRRSPGNLLAFFFCFTAAWARQDGGGVVACCCFSRCCPCDTFTSFRVSPVSSWSLQPADNETHLGRPCPQHRRRVDPICFQYGTKVF